MSQTTAAYATKSIPPHPHWVETYSGVNVDLLHPTAAMIKLSDIAWQLARIPRFNGACNSTVSYSVADHSLWVAHYCHLRTGNARIALQALLHDAHEAYTGDIVTPIKHLPGVKEAIEKLQTRLQNAILSQFGLTHAMPAVVLEADAMALAIEASMFLTSGGEGWTLEALDKFALCATAPEARKPLDGFNAFISAFNFYTQIYTPAA